LPTLKALESVTVFKKIYYIFLIHRKDIAFLNQQAAQQEQSDAEVIRLYLANQDARFFSILYRRYANKVYGKCISILKNDAEARDAMQDIFVKIMLNLGNFGEKSQFSTWVYSITYNYCIDTIRKKKKEKTMFSEDIERAPDVAADEVPDQFLMEMDIKNLKVVLEALPDSDRLILMMKYHDDMSIKEIADMLSKTESAVKMKIKRAKEKAKELFDTKFKRDE
jgi:RNA polymerase sigma-70 factor (ECF subfamily)